LQPAPDHLTMRPAIRKRSAPRRSRFVLFKALAFTLAAVIIWLVVNAQHLQEFLRAYDSRNTEMERNELLRQDIRNARHQRTSLEANGTETEREVRERLNMHLPGEQVIYLKPPATSSTVTSLEIPHDQETTKPRSTGRRAAKTVRP